MTLTALLICYKGELPPHTDIKTLICAPEFLGGEAGNKTRDLDELPECYPTNPRVCHTHMPQHHVNSSGSRARFVYVMR